MNIFRGSQKGQAIVLMVLAFVGLVGLVSLAIDGGRVLADCRQAQNAADNAALAAALKIIQSGGSANYTAAANTIAAQNGYTHNGTTTIVSVQNPPLTGCTGDSPYKNNADYVEVTIKDTVNTFFGGVVGIQSTTNCVEAIAYKHFGGPHGPVGGGNAIITLSPTGNGFKNTAGGAFTVAGGIYVDSSDSQAFTTTSGGAFTVTGGAVNVVGGASYNSKLTPQPTTGVSPMADPLSSLTPPPNPGNCQPVQSPGTATFNPGCYAGFSLSSGPYTFNPGIYYINGGNFTSSASQQITANGVLFYFTTGSFKSTGGGGLVMSAPTSGPYTGLGVYLDQNTNTSGYITVTAGGSSEFDGTWYAPNATTTLTGGGGVNINKTQIICNNFIYTGGGGMSVGYDSGRTYNGGVGQPVLELVK